MRRIAFLMVLAIVLPGCGGSDDGGSSSPPTTPTPTAPTQTNRAPSIISVTVSPAFGVSGLTVISMSASASDADNDPISYSWEFAGKTATGPTVASSMTGDGPVTVRLTVNDGKGATATDTRSVTIGTMTGRWGFIFTTTCNPNVPTILPVLTLTQFEGGVVTGDLASPAAWCNVPAGQTGKLDPAAPAKIDAAGNFTGARLKIGSYADTMLSGTMDATGRVITGTTRSVASGRTDTFRMTKQ